jgi:glutathione S-transferase
MQPVHWFFILGYAPEKLKYPIDRYVNESHRLYRVLDRQLAKNGTGYIVGDRVTVADIAIWPWVAAHSKSIIPLSTLILTCSHRLLWTSLHCSVYRNFEMV